MSRLKKTRKTVVDPRLIQTESFISDFSISVIKHRNQDNLQKKVFVGFTVLEG